MNNFERQDVIDEMTAKYTDRELADMVVFYREALAVTQDRLDKANYEISRMTLENALEKRKIKADAVREAANVCWKFSSSMSHDMWRIVLHNYANNLEAKK